MTLSGALIRRLQAGAAWSLLATIFGQGATFLTNILLANALGMSRFGEYALVLATLQFVAGIGGLGSGYAATRYLSEYARRDRKRTGRTAALLLVLGIGSAVLLGSAMVLLSPVVADRILHAPHLATAVRLAGLGAAAAAATSTLVGSLAGLERFGTVARAAVLVGTLYVAGAVTGSQLWGVTGAIAGVTLAGVVQAFVLFHLLRRALAREGIVPTLAGSWQERRILTRWIAPGLLSGLTAMGGLWFAQTTLARQPGGFAALAGYVAAYNLMVLGLLFPNVLNNVAMAVINALRGEGARAAYRQFFFINLRFTALAQVCAMAFLILAGEYLLRLYGGEFEASRTVLLILVAASLPEALTVAVNQVIQSNEQIWRTLLWVNLPRDTVLVVAALLLIPRFGAIGLATAYVAARVVGFVGTFLFARTLGLRLSADTGTEAALEPLPT